MKRRFALLTVAAIITAISMASSGSAQTLTNPGSNGKIAFTNPDPVAVSVVASPSTQTRPAHSRSGPGMSPAPAIQPTFHGHPTAANSSFRLIPRETRGPPPPTPTDPISHCSTTTRTSICPCHAASGRPTVPIPVQERRGRDTGRRRRLHASLLRRRRPDTSHHHPRRIRGLRARLLARRVANPVQPISTPAPTSATCSRSTPMAPAHCS